MRDQQLSYNSMFVPYTKHKTDNRERQQNQYTNIMGVQSPQLSSLMTNSSMVTITLIRDVHIIKYDSSKFLNWPTIS
jgi:hypothetical protein